MSAEPSSASNVQEEENQSKINTVEESSPSEVFKEEKDENSEEKASLEHEEDESNSEDDSSVSIEKSEDSEPLEQTRDIGNIGESLVRDVENDYQDEADSEEGLIPDSKTKFTKTNEEPIILHPLEVRGAIEAEVNSTFVNEKSKSCILF